MCEREHHRHVAEILRSLDTNRLADARCYFGGGTAVALRYGELRISTDVDFLVSDRLTYRRLREQITENGLDSIFRRPVPIVRGPVTDQYGIRTLLGATEPIKFEIVREGRIDFDTPEPSEQVCGVACLTAHDLVASKLLANDDRWADRALYSRDIIDLAIIAPDADVWNTGMRKAQGAYGKTVHNKLIRAIDWALDQTGWLTECATALQITAISPDDLRARIQYIRHLATGNR